MLADSLRTKLPFLAIGGEIEEIGTGKVVAEDIDWRDDFKNLASQASLIMVLPFNQPSTVLGNRLAPREQFPAQDFLSDAA